MSRDGFAAFGNLPRWSLVLPLLFVFVTTRIFPLVPFLEIAFYILSVTPLIKLRKEIPLGVALSLMTYSYILVNFMVSDFDGALNRLLTYRKFLLLPCFWIFFYLNRKSLFLFLNGFCFLLPLYIVGFFALTIFGFQFSEEAYIGGVIENNATQSFIISLTLLVLAGFGVLNIGNRPLLIFYGFACFVFGCCFWSSKVGLFNMCLCMAVFLTSFRIVNIANLRTVCVLGTVILGGACFFVLIGEWSVAQADSFSAGRFGIWQALIQTAESPGLFGLGLGAVRDVFNSGVGTSVYFLGLDDVHNQWLHTTYELGIFGIALVVSVFVSCWVSVASEMKLICTGFITMVLVTGIFNGTLTGFVEGRLVFIFLAVLFTMNQRGFRKMEMSRSSYA